MNLLPKKFAPQSSANLNLDDLTILMRMKELRITMVTWGISSIRRSFDLKKKVSDVCLSDWNWNLIQT